MIAGHANDPTKLAINCFQSIRHPARIMAQLFG